MDNNSRNDSDVVEIDLGEILALLWHKAWLIAICAIVMAICGFCVSKFLVTEQFESTTKVYILNKQDNSTVTMSDVQLGSQLTKDYAQLIKSRKVLEEVIKECQLLDSYESLSGRIAVTIPSDTRIISITVTDPDPAMAQLLADTVRKSASAHIKSVMDIQAVNVVDEANLPEYPASPSVAKWTAIGFLVGAFICAACVLVHYMLDDTIKTSDDVERYLGLSTLGMIPIREETGTSKHGGKKSSGSGSTSSNSGKSSKEGQRKTSPAYKEMMNQDTSSKKTSEEKRTVNTDTLAMMDVEAVNQAVKEGK